MEEWRIIPNSIYEISSHGNLRRIGTITNYKLAFDGGGYKIYPIIYNSGRKTKRIHRLIGEIFIPNPSGLPQIDHINGDRGDNRIANLRWCSRNQNQHNKGKCKTNTSGFKGVCREDGKWRASIWLNNKFNRIGSFDTPEEAFDAYKAKARELHGEFARF
jgi:hypothetical protein